MSTIEHTVTDLDPNELAELEFMANELDPQSAIDAETDAQTRIDTAEADMQLKGLLVLVQMGFYGLSCPNWKVTTEECETMADAYLPVIEKYFPDAAQQLGPVTAAVLITGGVLGQRIAQGIPRKLPDEALEHESTISES